MKPEDVFLSSAFCFCESFLLYQKNLTLSQRKTVINYGTHFISNWVWTELNKGKDSYPVNEWTILDLNCISILNHLALYYFFVIMYICRTPLHEKNDLLNLVAPARSNGHVHCSMFRYKFSAYPDYLSSYAGGQTYHDKWLTPWWNLTIPKTGLENIQTVDHH